MIPTIDLARQDTTVASGVSRAVDEGARLFLEHGVLIVKNAFEARFLSALHDAFVDSYSEHFVETEAGDHRRVGHRRNMVTLVLEGPFNSPDLYANPGLMPILERLLERSLIINSMSAVTSLPGAEAQHIHTDHANIYLTDSNSGGDDSWLGRPPPYAITVAIPLVPITEDNGCTLFWPGTHVRNVEPRDQRSESGERHTCDLGTCVLFDYRIIHGGAANRSEESRPVLYCVYSRNWFRDVLNYQYDQAPLSIQPDELRQVPEAHRGLFSWAFEFENA